MIQSPYRRGADDGFIFGIYLTVMFFASIFSSHLAPLSMLSFAMMVCVPLVIYRFMARYDKMLGPAGTFAMLWMHGVVIFFCAMLIAGSLLVIYMEWVNPDFVSSQLRAVATLSDILPGDSNASAISEVAETMLKTGFMPSPIEIVTQMIMLAIVTGSLLSMTLSAIFSFRRRKTNFTE